MTHLVDIKPITADWRNFETQATVVYYPSSWGQEQAIIIPEGFRTDFASVPRLLWWAVSPMGKHSRAAILHDWLYQSGEYSRKQADSMFLQAMKLDGVKWWRRTIMYYSVRLLGWRFYCK